MFRFAIHVLNNPFTHISSLKKYDGLSVDHALKIALAANEAVSYTHLDVYKRQIFPRTGLVSAAGICYSGRWDYVFNLAV